MRAASPATGGAIGIALLWAFGVALAVWMGNEHGMVSPEVRDCLPFEWRGVLFVSAEIGIESLLLFRVLFGFRHIRWPDLQRTLIALGLFFAIGIGCVLTTFTDMPGWFYVNTWWVSIVLLLLIALVLAQGIAAMLSRERA
jgi:hypothetical protein